MYAVGHLHCRYVVPPEAQSGSVAARLDAAVRQELDAACHEALREAMGPDPTVYLVREIDLSIAVSPQEGPASLAQRWAREVGRVALQRASDPSESLRFDDWPTYLSAFAIDVVEGRELGHWYYEPLAEYVQATPGRTLSSLLSHQREHLPALVAVLRRQGRLEGFLARLGPETVEWLWQNVGGEANGWALASGLPDRPAALRDDAGLSDYPRDDRTASGNGDETAMVLIAAAVAVELGLWRGAPEVGEAAARLLGSRPDVTESDARSRLAARPALEWAAREERLYRQAGGPVSAWGSPQRAAWSLVHALEFLLRRGVIAAEGSSLPRDRRPGRLRDTVAALAWADREVLEPALGRYVDPLVSSPHAATEGGLRPTGATEAQATALVRARGALAESLRDVVRSTGDDGHMARVLAYGALADALRPPDGALAAVADRLVDLLQLAKAASDPTALLAALRAGDAANALAAVGAGAQGRFRSALEVWTSAAPRLEHEVWHELTQAVRGGPSAERPPSRPRAEVEPAPQFGENRLLKHAGLYLLVRPMIDLRLANLVRQTGLPAGEAASSAFASILAGVAYCLTGDATVDLRSEASLLAGDVVPSPDGLKAWAGLAGEERWHTLQSSLARTLVQRRALSPTTDVVIDVAYTGAGTCVLLGAGDTRAWLLGRCLRNEGEVAATAAELLRAWHRTGARADVYAADEVLPLLARGTDLGPVLPLEAMSPSRSIHPLPGMDTVDGTGSLSISLVAQAIVTAWSQWLTGLGQSSPQYLWRQLLDRKGYLRADDGYVVLLESRPLDVVLRLSGSFDPVASVPWLGGRSLSFEVEG